MGNFCDKSSLSSSQPPTVNPNPIAGEDYHNGTSPASSTPAQMTTEKVVVDGRREQKACFGAGCYWGTEKYFRYDYKKHYTSGKWLRGQVGFMGPADAQKNPDYKDVCSGSTGHVEVNRGQNLSKSYLTHTLSMSLSFTQ